MEVPTIDWRSASREERLEWIKGRALDNWSARQTGDAVGVSRNTILGLANRARPKITFRGVSSGPGGMGWQPHQRQRKKPARPDRQVALVAPKPPELISKAVPAAPMAPTRTLLTVDRGECHFPMFSDATLKATLEPSALPYCGARAEEGSEYCAFHRARMYTPRLAGSDKTA